MLFAHNHQQYALTNRVGIIVCNICFLRVILHVMHLSMYSLDYLNNIFYKLYANIDWTWPRGDWPLGLSTLVI